MKIQFAAGFGPLVRDSKASLRFYRDVLGLPLVGDDDYVAMDGFDGIKHFGQWTLEDAAESIFGTREWPADIPCRCVLEHHSQLARDLGIARAVADEHVPGRLFGVEPFRRVGSGTLGMACCQSAPNVHESTSVAMASQYYPGPIQ